MNALGEAADTLNMTLKDAEELFMRGTFGLARAEVPLDPEATRAPYAASVNALVFHKDGGEWMLSVRLGDQMHPWAKTSITVRCAVAMRLEALRVAVEESVVVTLESVDEAVTRTQEFVREHQPAKM